MAKQYTLYIRDERSETWDFHGSGTYKSLLGKIGEALRYGHAVKLVPGR